VGRFIREGLIRSAIEFAELGVDAVEVEPRDSQGSRAIEVSVFYIECLPKQNTKWDHRF
jgi:hypothetical protein